MDLTSTVIAIVSMAITVILALITIIVSLNNRSQKAIQEQITKQIQDIQDNTKTLRHDFNGYKEQDRENCSFNRREMYNQFMTKEIFELHRQNIFERFQSLETNFNEFKANFNERFDTLENLIKTNGRKL